MNDKTIVGDEVAAVSTLLQGSDVSLSLSQIAVAIGAPMDRTHDAIRALFDDGQLHFESRRGTLCPLFCWNRIGAAAPLRPPTVGQPWPEQGGVYVGIRLIDGQPRHIIAAPGVEHDILAVTFGHVDEAASAAGAINGHSDWRAPDQEDLMLAYVNARGLFVRVGEDSLYWSRSEHHGWPWAVDFEHGDTDRYGRNREFRVRPFRDIAVAQQQ